MLNTSAIRLPQMKKTYEEHKLNKRNISLTTSVMALDQPKIISLHISNIARDF